MTSSTHLYSQLFGHLRQHSRARDLRHLKALAWMVSALICSGQLSLSEWEAYVQKEGKQSAKRGAFRGQRFMENVRIQVSAIYLPLVLGALQGWQGHRLYLALDTTVLWDRFCMIHLSVVCCGRAIPLLWRVLEHGSATVAFEEYQSLLRRARWLLRSHPDVMLLADRGKAQSRVDEVVAHQPMALLFTLTLRCSHPHVSTLSNRGGCALSAVRRSSTV